MATPTYVSDIETMIELQGGGTLHVERDPCGDWHAYVRFHHDAWDRPDEPHAYGAGPTPRDAILDAVTGFQTEEN